MAQLLAARASAGDAACPAAGEVVDYSKISVTTGSFQGDLDPADVFGRSLGDLAGATTIAVGAERDDDGGIDRGAVWVLSLNAEGMVESDQKISSTAGDFDGALADVDHFGASVVSLGDLDHVGVTDIAVGAPFDDDDGPNRGAVWVLFLNSDGTVTSHQKISRTSSGVEGPLDNGDDFGVSVALLGDLDSNGVMEVAVGATGDDDGGEDAGAVRILSLDGCKAPTTIIQQPSPCAVLLPVGGGITTFSISAAGEPLLSYQWRKDGVALDNGGPILGADNPHSDAVRSHSEHRDLRLCRQQPLRRRYQRRSDCGSASLSTGFQRRCCGRRGRPGPASRRMGPLRLVAPGSSPGVPVAIRSNRLAASSRGVFHVHSLDSTLTPSRVATSDRSTPSRDMGGPIGTPTAESGTTS